MYCLYSQKRNVDWKFFVLKTKTDIEAYFFKYSVGRAKIIL